MATGTSFSFSYEVNDGDDLTHTLWNNAFGEFITNLDVSGINDDMADAAAMQTTSDPYLGAAAQLPSTLQVLLQQYAYQFSEILGTTYWYEDAPWSLTGSGITIVSGVLTSENLSPRIRVTDSDTNTQEGLIIVHETSGDMVDPFASTIRFRIKDGASSENTMAFIKAERDGADDTGRLVFGAYLAGSAVSSWVLYSAGDLIPGDTYNLGASGSELDQVWCDSVRTAGTLKLYSGAAVWTMETDGDLIPTGAYDIGASGSELGTVWVDSIKTAGTLNLYSGASHWAMQTDGDLIPTGAYDIGASGSELGTVWVDSIRTAGTLNLYSGASRWAMGTDGDLIPTGTYDIGASGSELDQIWCDSIRTAGTFKLYSGAAVWTMETDGDLIPTGTYDIGASGSELDQVWCDSVRTADTLKLYSGATYWTLETDGDLIPTGTYDIGASGSELDQVWCDSVRTAGTLKLYSGATFWTLQPDGDLIPTGTYDIGASGSELDQVWCDSIRTAGYLKLYSGVTYWTVETTGALIPAGSYEIGALGSEVDRLWCDSIRTAGTMLLNSTGDITILSGSAEWVIDTAGDLIPDGIYNIGASGSELYSVYTERLSYGAHDMLIDATTGAWYPGVDNSQDLGKIGNRYDDIYATNSTIQTSDETMKSDIKEIGLGLNFLTKINSIEFRWKGKTRKHFGFSAQQIEKVIQQEGIDSEDFAPLIKSEVNGKPRYGLRSGELMPILWKALQEFLEKLNNIEKKLAAMEVSYAILRR